jgi:hypothetical protein
MNEIVKSWKSECRAVMPVVITDWRRFSSGLWRVPKGDIAAAYCADILPKLKVFTHEGHLFTNGGSHFSGPVRSGADCYPLVRFDDYSGPDTVPYSYEGSEGRYGGRRWRLGSKIEFKASDPTQEDWTRLLRVLYADGGMFAHGVTYHEFLLNRLAPESPNEITAHTSEVALCGSVLMPTSQEEMLCFLIKHDGSIHVRPTQRQMELVL